MERMMDVGSKGRPGGFGQMAASRQSHRNSGPPNSHSPKVHKKTGFRLSYLLGRSARFVKFLQRSQTQHNRSKHRARRMVQLITHQAWSPLHDSGGTKEEGLVYRMTAIWSRIS